MTTETAATAGGTRAVDPALHSQVALFLAREAKLLDEGRDDEWFEMLADDLLYTVPVRQAAEPRSAEVNRSAFRLRDTKADIRLRLARSKTGRAYSEVPPSRTLRVVGGIDVSIGQAPDLIEASSPLLVYRQRGIDPHFDLIPCRRNDVLRVGPGGLRLVSREVLLTETSLVTPNLGILL
jgi:3-phenylpropionate/cinnamic acid dioxygenase small subunit